MLPASHYRREDDGLGALRPYAEANVQTGERFAFGLQPLLEAMDATGVGSFVFSSSAAT